MSGAFAIFMPFVLDETRASVLLSRKAAKLRKTTGDDRYQSKDEFERASLAEMFKTSLSRPVRMLLTEPVLLAITLWISFSWAVLCELCFEPMIPMCALFADIASWVQISSLSRFRMSMAASSTSASASLGSCTLRNLSVPALVWVSPAAWPWVVLPSSLLTRWARLQLMISTAVAFIAATWPSAARKPACILPVRYTVPSFAPEAGSEADAYPLFPAVGGGVCVPVGAFIFCFTAYAHVHWIGSCIGVVILCEFRLSAQTRSPKKAHRCWPQISACTAPISRPSHTSPTPTLSVSCSRLLAPVYGVLRAHPASPTTDASSALSAMSFIRNLVGAVFPLFTQQMYDSLGIQGATGLVSVSMRSRPVRIVTVRLANPSCFASPGSRHRARLHAFLDLHLRRQAPRPLAVRQGARAEGSGGTSQARSGGQLARYQSDESTRFCGRKGEGDVLEQHRHSYSFLYRYLSTRSEDWLPSRAGSLLKWLDLVPQRSAGRWSVLNDLWRVQQGQRTRLVRLRRCGSLPNSRHLPISGPEPFGSCSKGESFWNDIR